MSRGNWALPFNTRAVQDCVCIMRIVLSFFVIAAAVVQVILLDL